MRGGPERRSRWMSVPPPLLFLISFGAGILLDDAVPLPAVAAALRAAQPVGLAAVALGLLLAASAAGLFARRRTTIVPQDKARTLVASGPFRWTRNPMYLGLVLIHLGAAVAVGSYGALAAVLLPLWVLQARVIPYEERNLVEIFGEEYRRYARGTRRWI